MAYQPLSVRDGRREPAEPFEGVPPHLKPSLSNWLPFALRQSEDGRPRSDNHELAEAIIVKLHLPVQQAGMHGLLAIAGDDPDNLLDVIDMLLYFRHESLDVARLDQLLHVGLSVWQVAPDHKSLERRVDRSAREAAAQAMSPEDQASADPAEAWSKVYGRHPDPSDAWDHAIKAVEELAIPVVCPGKAKSNLGGVAGDLKAQPGRWAFALEGQNGTGVETFEAMLRLMWPNPDRHGGSGHKRKPSLRPRPSSIWPLR